MIISDICLFSVWMDRNCHTELLRFKAMGCNTLVSIRLTNVFRAKIFCRRSDILRRMRFSVALRVKLMAAIPSGKEYMNNFCSSVILVGVSRCVRMGASTVLVPFSATISFVLVKLIIRLFPPRCKVASALYSITPTST